MRLTANRDDLLKALGRARGAMRKSGIPILNNVLLTCDGGRLAMTGTDIDSRIATNLQVEPEESGACTVEAERLHSALSTLPAGALVTMAHKEPQLHISCGRAKFRLPTLPVIDFPAPPKLDQMSGGEIDAAALVTVLDRAQIAACTDALYPQFQGVRLWSTGSHLRADATNKKVWVWAQAPFAGVAIEPVTVPTRAVNEMKRLMSSADTVLLQTQHGRLRLVVDDTEFLTATIAYDWPNMPKMLDYRPAREAVADAEELMGSIRRAMSLSGDGVTLKMRFVSDNVELTGKGEHGFGSVDDCPCEFPHPNEAFTINLNGPWLAQALDRVTCSQVRMLFDDPKVGMYVEPVMDEPDGLFICGAMLG